jgi:hypothetical protein
MDDVTFAFLVSPFNYLITYLLTHLLTDSLTYLPTPWLYGLLRAFALFTDAYYSLLISVCPQVIDNAFLTKGNIYLDSVAI